MNITRKIKRKYWFNDEEISQLNIDSLEKAKKYISQRTYQSFRPNMDNLAWNEMLRNKYLCTCFLKAHDIPHPKQYGFLHSSRGFNLDGGNLLNGIDLFSLIEKNSLSDIVLKHVVGGLGQEVYVLKVLINNNVKIFALPDESIVDEKFVSEICKKKINGMTGYVVEEKVALHDVFREITMDSLSSVRIYSLRRRNGHTLIQYAYLHLGRVGALTDHLSRGALYAKIDTNTGVIREGIKRNGKLYEISTQHPDSGKKFYGIEVPYWNVAKKIIISAANAIPGINFIGWDLVISNDGPFVTEGNVGNNMLTQQVLLGGHLQNGVAKTWSEELGIELPDGSLGWRLRHWALGRRLSCWENLLSKAVHPIVKQFFPEIKPNQ